MNHHESSLTQTDLTGILKKVGGFNIEAFRCNSTMPGFTWKDLPDSENLQQNWENGKFRLREDLKSWMMERKKGESVPGLYATITRPNGKNKPVDVYRNEQDSYSIAFLPKETGEHTLSVLKSGEHLEGSPYEFIVRKLERGGQKKCLAYGRGLECAAVGAKAKFNIITAEAGEGRLSISVEGPSKPEINYQDRKDGSSGVAYSVTEPGQYKIAVKFDDEHIPGSPYTADATGVGTGPTFPRVRMLRGKSDFTKVKTAGVGLISGILRKESTFVLDCSEAGSDMLVIGILGPTAPCEDISVRHNDKRCYKVKYRPMERGDFTIVLKWGENDVVGSPFRVRVS